MTISAAAPAPGTINVRGVLYEVVRARAYDSHGKARQALTLRRPAGRRTYYAVRYENGALSSVV